MLQAYHPRFPWARWTRPAVALVLLACGLLLTGCGPKDPLDIRIEADTPGDFNDWWNKTRPKFSNEVAREFEYAFQALSSRAPRARGLRLEDKNDPFCKAWNGRAIRRLIIAAYHERNAQLQEKILHSMSRVQKVAEVDPAHGKDPVVQYREAMAENTDKYVESINAEIERNNARIRELTPAK